MSDPISSRMAEIGRKVDEYKRNGTYFFNQEIESFTGSTHVVMGGRRMRMFASYSYLGLSGHPRIRAAAEAALAKYGTSTHGSRILSGTLDIHRKLERRLAEFCGREDAIVLSSGYVTNLSVISCVAGRGDFIFCDKLNHASIIDGCTAGGAAVRFFEHNDLDELDRRLAKVPAGAGKLVVVDAVFSMDGDIADLPRLSEICGRRGAWLMLDEAHSIGVIGREGRGIESHFDLPGAAGILMGTLSKSIPSAGGFVAGSKQLIEYLRHMCRGYTFSGAYSPALAAAALESLDLMADEAWRFGKMMENTRYFVEGLAANGLNTLSTKTPIVPVVCGSDEDAYLVTRAVQEAGVFVSPVISPAVPPGTARLRATVTAAHGKEDIDFAVEAISRCVRSVIPVLAPA